MHPGKKFSKYALLGDDIVIGDPDVEKYREVRKSFGADIFTPKEWISDCGGLEFAKKFRILDRDLSPISVKMI